MTANTKTDECRRKIETEYMRQLRVVAEESPYPFEDVYFHTQCPTVWDELSAETQHPLLPVLVREPPRGPDTRRRFPAPPERQADWRSLSICYVMLVHDYPDFAIRIINAINEPQHSFVIHIDRKAQQANYDVHHDDMENDPLYALYYRVFAMTNSHAGFELQLDGQEDFTIIQYNPTDEYTPHCDGTCDGTKHISHGRVASAVLYCKVADKGGATSFTKSDVFVKPKEGMATFFTYKGLDGVMDDGYTEHSGCPVLEGEKWITTVWMRDGVTAEEPWHMFDPDGVRMLDEDMEEEQRHALEEESEEETEEEL
jgi:hypothetical protein